VAAEPAPVLVERERELSVLNRAVEETRQGHGCVVLVAGPPGIGKTSLLRAATATASDAGFLRLRARAGQLERDFAYGCIRQLLEPVIVRATGAERKRLFAGAAAFARPLFEPTGVTQLSPPRDTVHAVLHGLYWLLSNLADDAPVALVVDDLQWADTESVRFLCYLAPRLDGLRVAVLMSTRPLRDAGPDVARLAAGPDTTVVRPAPLTRQGTATVCGHRFRGGVAPEFAAACHEATGGNPFYLRELLHDTSNCDVPAHQVRRVGPAAVAQAVGLRLAEAPAAASAVVRAVSVLGDGVGVGEVADLAGLDDAVVAGAADVLANVEILAPGASLEFAHPIVREAAYADIGPRERAEAHARAAVVLAARGAPAERVAAQISQAPPTGDAERVALLRRAAADALARGAPTAAVAWLGRALAEPPAPEEQADTLLELGRAELRIAAPVAVAHLSAAVDLIEEPGRLATAARLLGNALTWAGESDRAIDALESAIARIDDREQALFLEADLAAHAQEASRCAREAAAKRLARLGDINGTTPGERLVLASLGFERARASESCSDAEKYLEAALAGGRLLDEQELDVPPPVYVVVVGLLATDALDVADTLLARMLTDARARVSMPGIAFVLAHQCVASLRRGAVDRAEDEARRALELLTAHEIPLGSTLALAVLMRALVEGSDLDGAERALDESGPVGVIPPGLVHNPLLEARGMLRLAQGRTGEGLDDLLEFGRRDAAWGGANPLASRWRSRAALAFAAAGEAERARAMVREDLERARRWGAPSGLGVALRAQALVEGGNAIVLRLRVATEVLGRSPARLDEARALVDLGAALRRANQRREARPVLEQGFRLAANCGAAALAEQARAEIRAAGGRVEPSASRAPLLTASERRVAELAADGLSNPEIAQSLFVTCKTVETHLSSVYRKLGISGRGKLWRVLQER
jgi:DNA-binding CsgD family transcriptional regulator